MKYISYHRSEIESVLDAYQRQFDECFAHELRPSLLTQLNSTYKKPTGGTEAEGREQEEEEDGEDLDKESDEGEEEEDGEDGEDLDKVPGRKRKAAAMEGDSEDGGRQPEAMEGLGNYSQRLQHGLFGRDKKLKISILSDARRNIFLTFDGFKDAASPYQITDMEHVYAVNSADIYDRLSGNYRNAEQPSIAISGGIVVPNTSPVFSQIRFDDDRPPVDLLTGDFTSLYPTTCQFANICQSTAAYNPHYAVRIGNYLYDPFDEQCFNQVAAPLKINTDFTSVATFIIRPEIWTSCTSALIADVKKRRKETKEKMAEVKVQLGADSTEHHILDFLQNAYKLLINTLYGIYLSPQYPSYRPYLGTLVTFYGRMALLRFFFSFHWALFSANVNIGERGVLGGDTDSLFVRCTRPEMVSAIKTFEGWPSNRGVYGVELEKQMWDGVFLGKKNYIMHGNGKYIIKGFFKRSYAPPCRTFLAEVLRLLFNKVLRLSSFENLAEVEAEFDKVFVTFDAADEENFTNRQIMKKDLKEYATNTNIVRQLRHIEQRDPSKSYLRGYELLSRHYDYVFVFYQPNSASLTKVAGPVDPQNVEQARYIAKFPRSTVLVEDNVEWCLRHCKGFVNRVSRTLTLKSDLKNAIMGLFKAFARSNVNHADLFQKIFCAAYKRRYGTDFLDERDKMLVKGAILKREKLPAAAAKKVKLAKLAPLQKKLTQLGFALASANKKKQ